MKNHSPYGTLRPGRSGQCALVIPFPKQSEDAPDYETTDLNRKLITNPHLTYGLTAQGGGLEPEVYNGDLLIVDRILAPQSGDLVIVETGNELLAQQYSGGKAWGVVTYTIRNLKRAGPSKFA